MSDHNQDVACQAAETFTTHFYQTINDLLPLDSFYVTSCSSYTSSPQIAINGHQCTHPSQYESLLKTQANGLTKRVIYTMQSIDAQVLNPRYLNCAPEWVVQQYTNPPTGPGGNVSNRVDAISIVVQITGLVRFGNDPDAPPARNFTEHLVLVPNWDAVSPRGGGQAPRGARRWLIESQMWRAL